MDNLNYGLQSIDNNFLNCHGCTTKDVLVTSTYVHINCGSKFAKNASYLSTMCPRILLSGPAGKKKTISDYCL